MRRNLYSSLGVQWISAALGVVSSILVARMMQPGELGVFTVTMALVAVVVTLQQAGANEYLLYSEKVDTATRRSVFGMTTVLTALVCGGLLLGRPLLVRIYGDPGVGQVATVAAAQMALWTITAPINAMLMRDERFDLIAATVLAQNVVLSIFQVAFTWAGFSFLGLAWAGLIASVVSTLAHFAVGRRFALFRPSLKGVLPILSFGGKLFTANALNTLNSQGPAMVIGALSGLAQGALYGRANMIAQIYQQTISRAVDPLVNARIAADTRTGAGATAMLVASSRILLTLSVAFFGFVALTAHLIVPLIFGEQWRAAAPAMRALAIGFLVWPVTSPTTAVVLAAQRPGVLVRLRAVNLAARAVAVVGLAPWGLEAVCWGIAATVYLNLGQSLHAARVAAGVRLGGYLGRLGPSLLAGAAPLLAAGMALALAGRAGLEDWPTLLVAGAAMAVATAAALVMGDHPLWREAKVLTGRWRARST